MCSVKVLLRQLSWVEFLMFFLVGVSCVIYIFNNFTYYFMVSTSENQIASIGLGVCLLREDREYLFLERVSSREI